jgi:hypothetical protein
MVGLLSVAAAMNALMIRDLYVYRKFQVFGLRQKKKPESCGELEGIH